MIAQFARQHRRVLLQVVQFLGVCLFFGCATWGLWQFLEPWLGVDVWMNFDNRNYHTDMLAYGMARLAQGQFPLWNPYQAAGVPFFAALQGGVLYPPNWLALHWPAETVHEFNKYLHLNLAAISVYYYARVLGLGRRASAFAGLFYVAGNYFLVFTLFETGAYPIATLGAILACVEVIVHSDDGRQCNRWSVLFVVVLTCQILAGYIQSVVFTGYMLCLYVPVRIIHLYCSGRRMGRQLLQASATIAILVCIVGLIASIQLLPLYEMSLAAASHNLERGMQLSAVNIWFIPNLSFWEALRDPLLAFPRSLWEKIFWGLVVLGALGSSQRVLALWSIVTGCIFLTLATGTCCP
jgi:hypothetical protein